MATRAKDKWMVLARWTPELETERRYSSGLAAVRAAEEVAGLPWNLCGNGALVRPPKGRSWYVRR